MIKIKPTRKIKEKNSAILFQIAEFESWIPKKYYIDGFIYVKEEFVFQLQKYKPKKDIFKTSIEVEKIIEDYINYKDGGKFDFENEELLDQKNHPF